MSKTVTLASLVSTYNTLATAKGLKTRKGFDNKAAAEAAIKTLKATRKSGASLKVRKAAQPHLAGPRGFKFGPVFLASVAEGAGVALKAVNLPKLVALAESKEVAVTPDLTQAEIAAMVAKAI